MKAGRHKNSPATIIATGLAKKNELGPSPKLTTYNISLSSRELKSFLLPFTPFYSLRLPFVPYTSFGLLKCHGPLRMARINQLLCCHYKQQVLAPSWSHKRGQQKSTGFMVEPQTRPGMRPGTEPKAASQNWTEFAVKLVSKLASF